MKLGSFDTIGNIAILPLFTKNPKSIAKTLLTENKNIKSVFMKVEKIKGRLRTRKLKYISGEKIKETIHKESGCLFKLDIEKCYFSPRLSNDRIEIMKQVKPGERVLVMFSGVGPYGIIIAKNTKAKEVYMIELSRIAEKYQKENIKLNKLNNVISIQGDVRKIIPKLKKKGIKFDRIIMTRPQLKDDFLDVALQVAKESTIIHFYDFLKEEEIPEKAFEKISKAIEKFSKKPGVRIESWKLIRWKRALEIGPRRWRVRVDFYVF
ncbi:MAG: RsmD family RNA methyltransferase [Candidatus Pacearchaeota archaeon]